MAHTLQKDIGLGKDQLLGQRHQLALAHMQHVAVYLRELPNKIHGYRWFFFDQHGERTKGIKQKVWVELVTQGSCFGQCHCLAGQRHCLLQALVAQQRGAPAEQKRAPVRK